MKAKVSETVIKVRAWVVDDRGRCVARDLTWKALAKQFGLLRAEERLDVSAAAAPGKPWLVWLRLSSDDAPKKKNRRYLGQPAESIAAQRAKCVATAERLGLSPLVFVEAQGETALRPEERVKF